MLTVALAAMLAGAPEDIQRIEQCWLVAHRMESDGISQPSIEAWVTRCIGEAVLRHAGKCNTRKWSAEHEQRQAVSGHAKVSAQR